MNIRAAFLICVVGPVLHLPFWLTLAVMFGYQFCEFLDKSFALRTRRKALRTAFDGEIFGWTSDPKDQDTEVKGDSGRFRLTGNDQVIFVRLARYFGELSEIPR